MSVTYDALFEAVKAVLHELEEEVARDSDGFSIACLKNITQAIGRIFDYLLVNSCRHSQVMQGLVVAESIQSYLSLWLKKQATEVHFRAVEDPKGELSGEKSMQVEAIGRVFGLETRPDLRV